jgi:hypothetical protein
MEQFVFATNRDNHDYRSQFANDVCQLILDKYKGDIDESLKYVEVFYDHFEEYVRNIYELIDCEIPLFALYDLKRYSMDNWGFTQEEYDEALKNTYAACKKIYKLKK